MAGFERGWWVKPSATVAEEPVNDSKSSVKRFWTKSQTDNPAWDLRTRVLVMREIPSKLVSLGIRDEVNSSRESDPFSPEALNFIGLAGRKAILEGKLPEEAVIPWEDLVNEKLSARKIEEELFRKLEPLQHHQDHFRSAGDLQSFWSEEYAWWALILRELRPLRIRGTNDRINPNFAPIVNIQVGNEGLEPPTSSV